MTRPALLNPDREPTDEEFRSLLHNAGEDARSSRDRAYRHLRELLAEAREEARGRQHGTGE